MRPDAPTLLIVEDEPSIARPLATMFQHEGYAVRVAMSGAEACQAFDDADLVVLDWMLPDAQGIDLLRAWRTHSATPIIFLSARTDLVDRVVALELGADDYVGKPFEPRELLARVRVCLRRVVQAEARPSDSDVFRLQTALGSLVVDAGRRRVELDGREATGLTRMEFELLRHFASHPGRVFSRDELLDRVWGYDAYPTTRNESLRRFIDLPAVISALPLIGCSTACQTYFMFDPGDVSFPQ